MCGVATLVDWAPPCSESVARGRIKQLAGYPCFLPFAIGARELCYIHSQLRRYEESSSGDPHDHPKIRISPRRVVGGEELCSTSTNYGAKPSGIRPCFREEQHTVARFSDHSPDHTMFKSISLVIKRVNLNLMLESQTFR